MNSSWNRTRATMQAFASVGLLWAIVSVLPASAQDSILAVQVSDAAGRATALSQLTGERPYTVLLFLGADCPLSQKALNEVVQDTGSLDGIERVAIAGVMVSRDDDSDLRRISEVYSPRFPLFRDLGNALAARLGVQVVPTAVLLDQQGKVLYRGRVNDRVEALGRRTDVRRHDLREALSDVLGGKPVRVEQTTAVGCAVVIKPPAPIADSTVDFYRDVQPILFRNCTRCHQPDGVGPFSFIEYDDATSWLELGLDLVSQRIMPPGQGESDFEFENPTSGPSADELKVLKKWIEEGMPAGTKPSAMPALPALDESADALGTPDFVLDARGQMNIGPTGDDLYRYLVYELDHPEDMRVRAIRVIPGNRKVLHHALIFYGPSERLRRLEADPEIHGRELLASDRGPGFGFDMSLTADIGGRSESGVLRTGGIGGYVPGFTITKAPDGYVSIIPGHSDIFLQAHYHRTGRPEVDDTKIAVYLAKENRHPESWCFSANINGDDFLVMPPNERKRTSYDWPVEDDCLIVSVGPHGHNLTMSQTLTIIDPDGRHKVLLHVPAYDYNWQKNYRFKEPIPVAKGSVIRVNSLLDNTTANPQNPNKPPKAVFLGERTNDEMVFPFINLVVNKDSNWKVIGATGSLVKNREILKLMQKAFGMEPSPEPAANGQLPQR